MSGSEIERENIVADGLSASAQAKSADALHDDSPRELPTELHTWRPQAEGLYDPALEKDSCGVGFIANIKGKKSHQIVSDALSIPNQIPRIPVSRAFFKPSSLTASTLD